MNLIAILSCAMSLGLAAWALVLGDAVALTGILVMSFTTPLLCVGMCWRPNSSWSSRRVMDSKGEVPQGTVIIKSPNGCFTVVECDEDIARRLYFHPEHIDYAVSSFAGRGLSSTVGGLTLVGFIVLFGNAVWTIKAALAVIYTVLNLLYCVAAILPVRLSWHIDLILSLPQITHHDTFTRCLWTTICITKRSDWAREYVPKTEVWSEWLREAQHQAQHAPGPECWDPQDAIRKLLMKQSRLVEDSTQLHPESG
jgi:hypothetical protein